MVATYSRHILLAVVTHRAMDMGPGFSFNKSSLMTPVLMAVMILYKLDWSLLNSSRGISGRRSPSLIIWIPFVERGIDSQVVKAFCISGAEAAHLNGDNILTIGEVD
jgi:hypothetical protein